MTTEKKDKRAQTIAPELLEQWQNLKRHGDAATLAKRLKKSRPTIDNALTYGAVHDQSIIDGINKFFRERLESEIKEGKGLKALESERTALPAEINWNRGPLP